MGQDGGMHEVGAVRSELRDLEPVFHRPDRGTSRAVWDALMAPDYWEVGASGAVYDRAFVLDTLAARYADPAYDPMAGLELDDFAVREAGPGVWLATYRLRQGERLSRRVSVWRATSDGWQVAYHQGTVISAAG
jgi:hypothetical protein